MANLFINSINISNFRCFKEENITFTTPDNQTAGSGLNILIGENGGGKTTVLEAINFLTQSGFAIENRINLDDFRDFQQPISVSVSTKEFICKGSFKRTFKCNGFNFSVASRTRKSAGKILSSPFQAGTKIKPLAETYDGKTNKIDARDTVYSSSSIDGDDLNIFMFDKNRSRHSAGGNFKTIFDRICDDLNWKFVKNLGNKEQEYLNEYANSEGNFYSNSIEIAQKGVGQKLSDELSDFFDNETYKNLKIDLLSLLNPFSNAFFSIRELGQLNQISSKNLGSGIEIILTLLLLRSIYVQEGANGSIIFLIDEPELHLHPKAQEQLALLLLEESKTKQVVVASHSPYFLKPLIKSGNTIILNNKSDQGTTITAQSIVKQFFPWSPSWSEITYNAFGMPTVELHNELYGYLQNKTKNFDEVSFEKFLGKNNLTQSKSWIRERNGVANEARDVTLQTYIRHSIHHPENQNNCEFTSAELEQSINEMINLLKIFD